MLFAINATACFLTFSPIVSQMLDTVDIGTPISSKLNASLYAISLSGFSVD